MNKYNSMGRLLSMLHRLSRIYFQRELADYRLGHGQLPVLLYLYEHSGSTQHEIGAAFHMDKGSVSSLIQLLENNDYVSRERNPNDRREWSLFLTDRARDIMPRVGDTLKNWTRILLCGFTEAERETAFRLLQQMVDNAMTVKQEKR